MFDKIALFADRLISLSAFFATLCLGLEVVVIIIDVIGRYFGQPLTGSRDISQMAMVIVVFGGMALCDRLGGHISIDLLEQSLPRALIRLGDVLSPALGALIFLGIAWTVWESSGLSRMLNLATNIIYLPKAWFQYAVVALSLITSLGMFLQAIAALRGRELPAYDAPSVITEDEVSL